MLGGHGHRHRRGLWMTPATVARPLLRSRRDAGTRPATDRIGGAVAHVDVDTEALALAAARTAGAAGSLLGVAGPQGDPSGATGDAALGAAVAGLHATWAPAHRALLADLDALAAALRGAAAVLDGAESATAGRLAELLVPGTAAGPLRSRAV
ncbi:hypothetical protein BJF88_12480 [Cellulosimicrobium sp. CUA-896]|nr:hypothetical protein BJF88_12480 [Cellulosimicrobium sp. CUA-896]